MDRTVKVIVVLSVIFALLIAFAALYYAGVIPGSPGAAPAATAAGVISVPILVILIALAACKRRRKQQQ